MKCSQAVLGDAHAVVNVTGENARWEVKESVSIGPHSAVAVEDGGRIMAGSTTSGSNCYLSVSGFHQNEGEVPVSSRWNIAGDLLVNASEGESVVSVTDGGRLLVQKGPTWKPIQLIGGDPASEDETTEHDEPADAALLHVSSRPCGHRVQGTRIRSERGRSVELRSSRSIAEVSFSSRNASSSAPGNRPSAKHSSSVVEWSNAAQRWSSRRGATRRVRSQLRAGERSPQLSSRESEDATRAAQSSSPEPTHSSRSAEPLRSARGLLGVWDGGRVAANDGGPEEINIGPRSVVWGNGTLEAEVINAGIVMPVGTMTIKGKLRNGDDDDTPGPRCRNLQVHAAWSVGS